MGKVIEAYLNLTDGEARCLIALVKKRVRELGFTLDTTIGRSKKSVKILERMTHERVHLLGLLGQLEQYGYK